MKHNLLVLFVIIGYVSSYPRPRPHYNSNKFEADDKCRHYSGHWGKCVQLFECPRLVHEMQTERSEVSFVIQGDRCGSRNGKLYVCCTKEMEEESTKLVTVAENYAEWSFSSQQSTPNWFETESSTTTSSPEIIRFTPDEFDRSNDRGKGRGNDRDNDRGNDRDNNRGNDRDNNRDNERDNNRDNERDNDRDNGRGNDRGNDRDNNRGNDRNNNWGNERENERDNDRGNDRQGKRNHPNANLLPSNCGNSLTKRVLGGNATGLDEFPWIVLLQYRNPSGRISYECSGALITPKYILTAAHCINGTSVTTRNLRLSKVRLGEWDLSSNEDCQEGVCAPPVQDINVDKVKVHEGYEPRRTSQTNDIALIKLIKNAEINNYVQPICLPLDDSADETYEGKRFSVAGWGKTSNARGSSSNIKMAVEVPTVKYEECSSFYDVYYSRTVKIEKTQLCAGGEEGKDSCQGDSGSALMGADLINKEIKWRAVGIVSSGPQSCGGRDSPALYTKVSSFLDWILDNIKN